MRTLSALHSTNMSRVPTLTQQWADREQKTKIIYWRRSSFVDIFARTAGSEAKPKPRTLISLCPPSCHRPVKYKMALPFANGEVHRFVITGFTKTSVYSTPCSQGFQTAPNKVQKTNNKLVANTELESAASFSTTNSMQPCCCIAPYGSNRYPVG